jgi:hypothetical protein
MSHSPLRIVALIDSFVAPAWMHRALFDLVRSPDAEVALVGLDGSAAARPPKRSWFRAYEAADLRLFRFPDDHAELRDASPLFAGVATLDARPEARRNGRWALPEADLAAIRAAQPDVILKLGFPPLDEAVYAIPRLGVWTFDHLERARSGTPPFAWEMIRREPSTETVLRETRPGASRVLVRSYATTDPTSLHRGRNAALWKTASFVGRALQNAAAGRAGADEALPPRRFEAPRRTPNAVEVVRFAGRTAARIARHRVRSRREVYLWFVALREAVHSFAGGNLDGFRPVEAPPGRFFADPFLVEDGGRTWLFVEDGDLASDKGSIRCAEVTETGVLGESRIVLDRDYHLSYPFVFRHGDAWYMLPETSENRTIELWRATSFPWRWQLHKVLMRDVLAVDPTLLEHAGRLWLFAAMSEGGGAATDELFLFSAKSLDGEWVPHPANPIVSDVRRARPAGRILAEHGALHRPAQDCSGEYGAAVWLHRIDELNDRRYRETPVRRIGPEWWRGATATHTLARAGKWEAIDGRVWMRRGRSPK